MLPCSLQLWKLCFFLFFFSSHLNAISRSFPPRQQTICGCSAGAARVQMEALGVFVWVNMQEPLCVLAVCGRHSKLLLTRSEPSWSFVSDLICLCRARVLFLLCGFRCLCVIECVHTETLGRSSGWVRACFRSARPLSQCPYSSLKRCLWLQTHDRRPKLRKLSSKWQGPY